MFGVGGDTCFTGAGAVTPVVYCQLSGGSLQASWPQQRSQRIRVPRGVNPNIKYWPFRLGVGRGFNNMTPSNTHLFIRSFCSVS